MQKISLVALVFVLVACSAPAPALPTAFVTLTVPPTSTPTSIPTLTETATPIPTETPAPITQSDWVKMTLEQRVANVPVTSELGTNPTFLGDNPVAYYFNQEGVLVDGVNALTGEHLDEAQVFEALLDLNDITQKNSFRDDKYKVDTTEKQRAFLGIPIMSGSDRFELRQITYDGKQYFAEGKVYITRDAKDGTTRKIFIAKGVTDASGKFLYREEYDWQNTTFGVAYEVGFLQELLSASLLSNPLSIPNKALGYGGEPFDRMWSDEPYDGYEWPEDLSVFGSMIRPNDGEW